MLILQDMSGNPATDHDCDLMGWQELMAYGPSEYDLHISVPPDVDLDGEFLAFSHDDQEMIRVNGWLWTFEEVGE